MWVVGIILVFIAIALWCSARTNYSRHICHVINFKLKLLKMSEEDARWIAVYKRLPSIRVLARTNSRGDYRDYLSDDEQQRYFDYDVSHTEIKGRHNK